MATFGETRDLRARDSGYIQFTSGSLPHAWTVLTQLPPTLIREVFGEGPNNFNGTTSTRHDQLICRSVSVSRKETRRARRRIETRFIRSEFCARSEGCSLRSSAGQLPTTVRGTVLVCSSSCSTMNF